MNPEPDPAAASDASKEAPTGAPATANPAAPTQAPAETTPAMPGDDATASAPATWPEPLAPTSPASSAEKSLPAPSLETAAGAVSPVADTPPAAPELSLAGNLANPPELSLAACGARLAELFPALFVAPGAPGPAKPIKLRIHADIQARAPGVFTKRVLGIFFSRYTTTNAYLKALAGAPQRFDLDGQPAGEIAAEHRQAATEELTRRHALAAERRAAMRLAPRREGPGAADEPAREVLHEARPDRRPGSRPDARTAARPMQPRRDGQGHRPERDTGARPPPKSPRQARPTGGLAWPPPTARPERPPQQTRDAAPPATLPTDPAQRERAMLLRNFESSPLSKANFCALKGMTEAALDAALAQAQAERTGNGR